MTLQNTSVERKAIVPLTTDKETGDFAAATMATYTGSTIDFDLHYCHIYAAPTAVTGVDVDGGALATPVTLAGNVNTTTGKFTATLAGTYVVTFNLTSAAATDGIPWSDDSYGIQTLTFTINQKEVTLPTFSGTHSYNGSAQDFGFANYDKKEVTITGVEVKPNGGSTTTLTSIGTSSRADGSVYPVSWEDSNSNYPVTLDDSASIVKVSATDAGEYKLTFDLVDKKNYKWAPGVASDKKVSFTMERAPLTVTFGAPGSSTNFSWKLGDFSTTPGYLTVDSINGIKNSENVTVDLYWYSDSNKSAINPMYMTGVPDSTKYDVSQFDSFGVGTYYLCAVLANDKTGNNVNRNYKISTNDTNVTPQKNEVAVQKIVINAGTASVDDVKWQYQTAAMADPADYTGATLTYDKVSGNPVVYTMSITAIPNTRTATYA
ncbi:MAG: hypothetical protein K2N22_07210, partial [Clostridia bacterium]|nr:hypothetical protein [Clostridia bacterium]